MEEIFRFVALRAPTKNLTDIPTVSLISSSANQPTTIEELISEANNIDENDVFTSYTQHHFSSPLQTVYSEFSASVNVVTSNNNEVIDPSEKIIETFNTDIEQLIASDKWNENKECLRLTIHRVKFGESEQKEDLKTYTDLMRATNIVENFPTSREISSKELQTWVDAPIVFKSKSTNKGLQGRIAKSKETRTVLQKRAQDKAIKLLADRKLTNDTLSHVMSLPPQEYAAKPIDHGLSNQKSKANTSKDKNEHDCEKVHGEGQALNAARSPSLNLSLTPSALKSLPENVIKTFQKSGIDPQNSSVENLVKKLETQIIRQDEELLSIMAPYISKSGSTHFGSLRLSIEKGLAGGGAGSAVSFQDYIIDAKNAGIHFVPPFIFTDVDEVEDERYIKPSGVGQLLVVRKHLKGYIRTDISHIENVLSGESKVREHTTSVQTEEFFLTETEQEKEETKDLQSTERFELNEEAEQAIEERKKLTGEVTVSAKFGPSYKVDASVGAAYENSKKNSQKSASRFAREITETASFKVREKVKQQRSRRLIEEVRETNTHTFVNPPENEPISGVYQFLDKVYEAQTFDYGLRTFYDIIVPEPAALYISAFESDSAPTSPIRKEPKPFEVDPATLDQGNYTRYVSEYGATNVDSPPEPFTTVSFSSAGAREGDGEYKKARVAANGEITIPNGYQAIHVYVTASLTGTTSEDAGKNTGLMAQVGREQFNFLMDVPVDFTQDRALDSQQGSLPVAIRAYKASSYIVTIEVMCRRTAKALDDWKLKTHEKVFTAYTQELEAYRAELAKQSLRSDPDIYGRNPAANAKLAATEVKRSALTLLANKRLLFDAIDVDCQQVPKIDIDAIRAAGPTIRFLEQAFEWENLSYVLYPYFWGRKAPYWKRKILFDDTDPLFADFIRAGAARVQLAVRLGFEAAVDHFVKTGEPWMGGELPEITDELYLPFYLEQKNQLGAPGNEVPFDDPWPVRVPTSLVIISKENDLPKWEKNSEGEWEEVPSTP